MNNSVRKTAYKEFNEARISGKNALDSYLILLIFYTFYQILFAKENLCYFCYSSATYSTLLLKRSNEADRNFIVVLHDECCSRCTDNSTILFKAILMMYLIVLLQLHFTESYS